MRNKKISSKINKRPLLPWIISLSLAFYFFIAILTEPFRGLQYSISILGGFSFVLFTLSSMVWKEIIVPKKITLVFLCFLIWNFISTPASKDISDSIWETTRMLSYFFLFLVGYSLFRKRTQTLNIFLISFCFLTGIILVKDAVFYLLDHRLQDGVHFVGSFYWHNQMAGFLLFYIPLSFLLFLQGTKNWKKYLWLSTSFLALILLLLTYSRGGWVSFFVSSFFLVFIFGKSVLQRHWKKVLAVAVVGCTFVVLTNSGQFLSLLTSIPRELTAKRTVSGTLRVSVWSSTMTMIKDNPLLGVGPGAFGATFYAYQKVPWLYAKNTHNHYLQVASELGLVGVGLFLVLLFLILKPGLRLFTSGSKKNNIVATSLFLALIASCIHALVDFDWSTVVLFALFWLIAAAFVSQYENDEFVIPLSGKRQFLYLMPILFLLGTMFLTLSRMEYQIAYKAILDQKHTDAKYHIQKAIRFNPYDASFYIVYGQMLAAEKKYDEALRMYQKASVLSKFNSESSYQAGMLMETQKNTKKSSEYFREAIKKSPYAHPKLYVALAEVSDTKEATRILENAIENIFPLNSSFYGFEYLYDAIGFKADIARLYIELAGLKIQEKKFEEAKRLLIISNTKLKSTKPLLDMRDINMIE